MILDTSFFLDRRYFVSNTVTEPAAGYNTPTGNQSFQDLMEYREREVLIKALGLTQYNELSAQFTGNDIDPSALQKWKDLVDGKSYDGKTWQGLRLEVGGRKYSFLVPYVYFYWLEATYATDTGTGAQSPESANSVKQVVNPKQIDAWNDFIPQYSEIGVNMGREYSFFSNWNGFGMQWGQNNESKQVSLYRFLKDHPEDYDSSFFTQMGGVINFAGL